MTLQVATMKALRPTRVVLVDDHAVVLLGVKALVDDSPDFRVVGEFCDGTSALRGISELQPDLVLLDLRLGSELAPETCRSILRECPEAKVVILTGFMEAPLLHACLHEGAAGVLLKSSEQVDLLDGMRRVMRGEMALDPQLSQQDNGTCHSVRVESQGVLVAELRASEYRVLRLLAQGFSTAQIQNDLNLSANTVRSYIQAVLEKLDAHTRVQAVVKARALNIL